MSYPGHSLGGGGGLTLLQRFYLYSTAPADRAEICAKIQMQIFYLMRLTGTMTHTHTVLYNVICPYQNNLMDLLIFGLLYNLAQAYSEIYVLIHCLKRLTDGHKGKNIK